MTKPRTPTGSESSRDEDPTGVRALLSSLPEPEPMPEHVVDRINASLAAEQAERAARMSETSETSVTPLLSRLRARPARVLFATAGAAAAVALVAVVGSSLTTVQQAADSTAAGGPLSGVASPPLTEEDSRFSAGAARTAPGPAGPQAPAAASGGFEAVQSEVRYTRADFVKQARSLALASEASSLKRVEPPTIQGGHAAASKLASPGPLGTAAGLQACLRAIGADKAQVVRADVSTYEGKPAAVILATTNGKTLAYAVGRQCGPKGAFLLHPATAIPRP